ncbi:hypothetical protein JL720_1689 [Aureococcus anophagefferens]|nr:hypothetical protein JL720_1689 [Aureococcus anophagefferens]
MRTLLLASAVVVWCGALRQTRRVWRSRQLGSIDNLELEEIQIAEALAPDCARVRVGAIGLNFADVFSVLGLYAAFSEQPPLSVAGLEFAGTVEEAGAACGYAVGDRVFGFTRFGAFADSVTQRGKLLRPTPAGWTDAEAAALLRGGVGMLSLEICAALGCDAVGVVSSDAKKDAIHARFPAEVADGRFKVLVRPARPDRAYRDHLRHVPRFDVVLESLGGPWFSEALDRLAPMGRLVHFGATHSDGAAAGGPLKWLSLVPSYLRRPMVDPGELTSTNRAVFGFNLIWLTEREDVLEAALAELLDCAGGRPPCLDGAAFHFDDLPGALKHLQSGKTTGKVVVRVP